MILRLAFAKPNHHSDWSQLTRRRTISLSPLRSKHPAAGKLSVMARDSTILLSQFTLLRRFWGATSLEWI
jgi:hypothetical protein